MKAENILLILIFSVVLINFLTILSIYQKHQQNVFYICEAYELNETSPFMPDTTWIYSIEPCDKGYVKK